MDNKTIPPFRHDMQVSINSLDGKSLMFSYGTFKNFEDLIIEHLDDQVPLDVKLAPCGCSNLDCHVCKAGWAIDTWMPFKPTEMFYTVPVTEGQGTCNVYAIRRGLTHAQKEQAVETLQGLGYTLKSGAKCWRPPLGNNSIKTKNNIVNYIQKCFGEENPEKATPHINYIAAMADDILELCKTGLSPRELLERNQNLSDG